VTGKPSPVITWYRNGVKLFLENRMLCYTDRMGVCRLNIMNVSCWQLNLTSIVDRRCRRTAATIRVRRRMSSVRTRPSV
jgi:hypothetical protein